MSSGSETRRRTARLPVRVTPDELDELRGQAVASGFPSLARYVLARCLRTASRAPAVSKIDRQALAQVSGLLGRYGGNLNQIAHAANAGGDPIRADQVQELRAQVIEMQEAVRKALHRDR